MSQQTMARRAWEELRRRLGYLPARAPDHLFQQLKQGNYEERVQAAMYLAAIADPRATGPLIDAVMNSTDMSVVQFAVLGLGIMHRNEAIPQLAVAFECSLDRDLCGQIAYALAEIGPPAIPTLIRLFSDDSPAGTTVRDYLVDALTEVGEPAVKPLIQAMRSYRSEAHCLAATAILVNIGAPALPAIETALREWQPEHIRTCLQGAAGAIKARLQRS